MKHPCRTLVIIVGRSDTGDLEAQVRGSRHAWDIRLISIDGLLRLMRLKEELDDPKIMEKIRRVLMPQEFTKVTSRAVATRARSRRHALWMSRVVPAHSSGNRIMSGNAAHVCHNLFTRFP
jgi:hypothetical protein